MYKPNTLIKSMGNAFLKGFELAGHATFNIVEAIAKVHDRQHVTMTFRMHKSMQDAFEKHVDTFNQEHSK